MGSQFYLSPSNQLVPKPLPTDVLFGRDKIMFNHLGNVRFRALIQDRAKEYENAPQRRIQSSIVCEVVEIVRSYGGRFLRRMNGTWKIVSESEAIQKVGHALRDKKQLEQKVETKHHNPCEALRRELQSEDQSQDVQSRETSAKSDPKERLPNDQSLCQQEKQRIYREKDCKEDEKYAANAILALGTLNARKTKSGPARPSQVGSDTTNAKDHLRQLQSVNKAKRLVTLLPETPSPGVSRNHEGGNPSLKLTEVARRSTPLQAIRRRDPQEFVNTHVMLSNQLFSSIHDLEYHGFRSPLNGNINPRTAHMIAHKSLLASKTESLMQAHHNDNVLQHSPGRFSPGNRNIWPRANPNLRCDTIEPPQSHNAKCEAKELTMRPSVIFTDKRDNDGHWILYPIKVPKLGYVAAGWKLVLLPIDGKGEPIELDSSILRFQNT